jgi:transmembrane sensor
MNQDPREAAALWFARTRSGELDAAGRAAFEAWRAADERHDREYRALERVWRAAGKVPAERLLALAESRPVRGRSWRYAGIAVACLLALGIGVALHLWQQAQPVFTAGLETVRGQHKRLRLPDGSLVEANTQTSMQIGYYRDRRAVVLASGEASFAVEPDAARPFFVDAGKGRVRVTGTRFNVRRDGDAVAVSVLSGRVEVTGALDAGNAPVSLVAGQQARVDASGGVGEARRVDMAALDAWREGRIVFDDTPLAEVVREVSRYRAAPVRLAEPALAGLRVSGTFSAGDTDALLAALPKILPVRVVPIEGGGSEVRRP